MRLSALLSRGSLIGTDWQEQDFPVGVAFCIYPSLCTGEIPWKKQLSSVSLARKKLPSPAYRQAAMQGLVACGRGVWLTREREGKAQGSCRRKQERAKTTVEADARGNKVLVNTARPHLVKEDTDYQNLGVCRREFCTPACLLQRGHHLQGHNYWSHKTCQQHCILCTSPTSTFCPWEPSTTTAGCEVPATGMPWCFSLFKARAAQMIVGSLPCNQCHQPADEPLVMPWGWSLH